MPSEIILPENTPVANLMNIGPKTAQWLQEIGISTRGDLMKAGPVLTYKILKHRFEGINILALYALYGALHACHWNALSPEIKDQLKREAQAPLDIDYGGDSD